MVVKNILRGFGSTIQNKKMIAIYYLTNLFFAFLLMIPLRFMIDKSIGSAVMGEKLISPMEMNFVFEFLIKNDNSIAGIRGLVILVPILFWLSGLFLSGGAFAAFIHHGKFQSSMFWGDSGKYFGRFFRLFLWSIPVFIVFYCFQFIETGIQYLIYGKDPYESVTYWGAWIKIGLSYLGLLIAYFIFDYSRIQIVMFDMRSAMRALIEGLKFTFKHFGKAFGISLIYFILGGIILALYNLISDSILDKNFLMIILLILIQQIYMVIRTIFRLALYGSQSFFFKFFNSTETDDILSNTSTSI
jgi:hypothetical protein